MLVKGGYWLLKFRVLRRTNHSLPGRYIQYKHHPDFKPRKQFETELKRTEEFVDDHGLVHCMLGTVYDLLHYLCSQPTLLSGKRNSQEYCCRRPGIILCQQFRESNRVRGKIPWLQCGITLDVGMRQWRWASCSCGKCEFGVNRCYICNSEIEMEQCQYYCCLIQGPILLE